MTEIKMENGRSMVEMLGVLAVAGVLSIGGVAGYRYAIDKMNANDIINEVRKRAITASQQRVLGQNINLSEYGDNGRIKGQHAVTAANAYQGDSGFFSLTVSAVPQRVCDEILKQDWAMPVEMTIGGVVVDENTVCAEGDNEMLFAFANTLDSSLVPGEAGEDDGDEEEVQECAEGEYRLSTGECVTDSHPECADGMFYSGRWNSCMACPTEGSPVQNDASELEDTCEKCEGAKSGGAAPSYCIYCPLGVACENQCCGDGEKCQLIADSWPYKYTCVSGLENGECVTNMDCDEGYYCKNEYGCDIVIGTCQEIRSSVARWDGESAISDTSDTSDDSDNSDSDDSDTIVTFNGKEYTASKDLMSYHAAENFCKALGKSLVPLDENCAADELAAIKVNGSGTCSGWAHATSKWYWTSTKSGGCSSYYIGSNSSGTVYSGGWNYGAFTSHYALCR